MGPRVSLSCDPRKTKTGPGATACSGPTKVVELVFECLEVYPPGSMIHLEFQKKLFRFRQGRPQASTFSFLPRSNQCAVRGDAMGRLSVGPQKD